MLYPNHGEWSRRHVVTLRRQFCGRRETACGDMRQTLSGLAHSGIRRGCNPPANKLFCPEDLSTRGQLVALPYRAVNEINEIRGSQDPPLELMGIKSPVALEMNPLCYTVTL